MCTQACRWMPCVCCNPDRIQIVKGFLDLKGTRQETVYDVVWSDDRKLDANGNLPPLGNTVDMANATWTNAIGDPEMISVWCDPDFDPDVPAVYYARVLELPTPRWTASEAKRYGIDMPSRDIPMTTQERAFTHQSGATPELILTVIPRQLVPGGYSGKIPF